MPRKPLKSYHPDVANAPRVPKAGNRVRVNWGQFWPVGAEAVLSRPSYHYAPDVVAWRATFPDGYDWAIGTWDVQTPDRATTFTLLD